MQEVLGEQQEEEGRGRGRSGLVSMAHQELPTGVPGHQLLSLFDVFLKMSALLMVLRAIMNLFNNQGIFGSFFRDFMSRGSTCVYSVYHLYPIPLFLGRFCTTEQPGQWPASSRV